jgi:hypothetical protein
MSTKSQFRSGPLSGAGSGFREAAVGGWFKGCGKDSSGDSFRDSFIGPLKG